jgi:hypothetical protein
MYTAFAKVQNGIVVDLIVADQEFIDTIPKESNVQWIETTVNVIGNVRYDLITSKVSEDQTNIFRKNSAQTGFIYDSERDAFYADPKYLIYKGPVYLDEETCLWKPINGENISAICCNQNSTNVLTHNLEDELK